MVKMAETMVDRIAQKIVASNGQVPCGKTTLDLAKEYTNTFFANVCFKEEEDGMKRKQLEGMIHLLITEA